MLALTPTSYGLQPYRFLDVRNPALRQELRELAHGQPQLTDASRLLILLSAAPFTEADLERNLARMAEVRAVPPASLDGFGQMVRERVLGLPEPERDIWAARQACIALGNLMTAAALLGLDACPLEGFDHEGYDRVLKVPGYRVQSALAVGYRGEGDKYATLAKVRFPVSDLVTVR